MISWLCFEWKTGGPLKGEVPFKPLVIRPAQKSEEDGIAKAIKSAFSMDSAWGDVSRPLAERVAQGIEKAFSRDEPACVVLAHGTRVIGASVLEIDPDAHNHLISGPCILHEYRNRGLASGLLAASLSFLHEKNVAVARGLTRANSIPARFIYPKFGGISHPFNGDPLKLADE
jgi:GNAT superfamily N-acetyltransferase